MLLFLNLLILQITRFLSKELNTLKTSLPSVFLFLKILFYLSFGLNLKSDVVRLFDAEPSTTTITFFFLFF